MILYHHPKSLARSREFSLLINNEPVEVLCTDIADFALCALLPGDFPATVEVVPSRAPDSASIHPTTKEIPATVVNGRVQFTLMQPEKLLVAIPGAKRLYLFANPPETNPPAPGDPGVITFPAGQTHEMSLLTLEDGQTLYLPGGAVLKSRIHIKGKSGIRICGHGIFDGSFYSKETDGGIPSIILERCDGVLVEDITMIHPQGWMLMIAACSGATVRNLKQIGEVLSSDGIDVVGSRDVLVEDCFLHNNDDCVVIKAFLVGDRNLAATRVDARENVENVLVRNCTLACIDGNGMEIGHELSVDFVRGVTFRNIDVLHVHGQGAVFSIHNNDRALVSEVLFEDIRIEHCYSKLIDFRISRSRFSTDDERGRISGVILRDIRWARSPYNPGYTISLIGGWDAEHEIEDILIENFTMDGVPVRHLDELEICTRHCRNLRIESGTGRIS